MNVAALYSCTAVISLGLMIAVLPDEEKENKATTVSTNAPTPIAEKLTASPVSAEPTKPIELWSSITTLNIPMPGSDYSFPVTLQDLQTKLVKNVFTTRKEAYAPLEKEDGVKISFTVTITNPYDKNLVFPFETSFYLGHPENANFTSPTQRNGGCRCDANHYNKIYTADGKLLDERKFDKSCNSLSLPCIPFGPHETKSFIVRFNDPVRISAKNVWLHGLGLQKNPNKRSREDKGWFLNIEERKFSSRDTTIR